MQLMTSEPHSRRHHLLDTQSFYLNDNSLRQNINYTSAAYLGSALLHQDLSAGQTNLVTASSPSEIPNQNTAIVTISPTNTITESIPSETEFDTTSSYTSVGYQGGDSSNILDAQLLHQERQGNNTSLNSNNNTIANNNNLVSSHLNMNIQPTGFTKNHILNSSSLSATEELSVKKRREDLSRRPSYRKIFNDLTGLSGPLDSTPISNAHMITNVGQLAPPATPHRQSPQQPVTSSNQANPKGMNAPAGLQDPSIVTCQSPVSIVDLQTGASSAVNQLAQQQLQHSSNQQATHLHHHLPPPPVPQNPDHHHQQHARHQHHHHHQQQQQQHHHHQPPPPPPPLHHPQASQLHQVHHMLNTTTSPPITGKPVTGEEANKKRELRLQKNREAAKECRRKKKEYIKCLENRVAVLENQNKALIDELKTLKDLYCKSTNE